MIWVAFLASLGLVNISSRYILPNATFLLFFPHILFLFRVCRHSISGCFADCSPRVQEHSGESKPGNFFECENFLRQNSFVPIGAMSALASLQRAFCTFNTSFVGFGRIMSSLHPVFPLAQTGPHQTIASERLCFSTSCSISLISDHPLEQQDVSHE